MSGTEETVLGGRDRHPTGGNSVLCFGQVTAVFFIPGRNGLSEKVHGSSL